MTNRSNHVSGKNGATSPMPPPGEDILRDVLASLFTDCSSDLKPHAEALPDAAPARQLQDELRQFVTNRTLPAEIQFTAYLADVIITDAFRNFFGDLISSAGTDAARREVVERLAGLFSQLGGSLSVDGDAGRLAQLTAFREYVVEYLRIVRRLNECWVEENLLPDSEAV